MGGDYIKKLLIGLFCFTSVFVISQESFNHVNVQNGLSNNFVREIHEDRYGFMWLGTLEGLDRFDGVEVRNYNHRFPQQPSAINSVLHDGIVGRLWIGTEEGLYSWDYTGQFFEPVYLADHSLRVFVVKEIRDSLVVAGTSHGLFFVDPHQMEVRQDILDFPTYPGPHEVNGIYSDADGMWLTTSVGLLFYDFSSLQYEKILFNPEKRNNVSFTSLVKIGSNVFAGTINNGLLVYDTDNGDFDRVNAVHNNIILALYHAGDGELLIGTDGDGLLLYNVESYSAMEESAISVIFQGLSSGSIYSVYKDGNDRLWLGTYSGGLNYSKLRNRSFNTLHSEWDAMFHEKSVRSLFFHDNGFRFIGTREGLFVIDPVGGVQHFTAQQESLLGSNIILSFHSVNDDGVFIGTFGGGLCFYAFESKKIEAIIGAGNFENGRIYGFEQNRDGRIWIASLEGLFLYDRETGETVAIEIESDEESNHEFFSVFRDSSDRLWGGTANGFIVFSTEDKEHKPETLLEGARGFKVVHFFEDSRKNIRISTEKGGLITVTSDLASIERLTVSDGLVNNSVSAVFEDDFNNLWITTLRGLCVWSVDNNRFRYYSLADGLPGLVFNPAAVFRDNKGQLWLGNESGIIRKELDDKVFVSMDESVVITDLFVYGENLESILDDKLEKPIYIADEITLRGKRKNIGFRVISLDYATYSDRIYVYQLIGHKDDLYRQEGAGIISFEDVNPGSYVFKVKSSGFSLDKNYERYKSLAIHIVPYFYQRKEFVLLVFLVVLFFSLWGYMRIRKVRQRLRAKTDGVVREKYEASRLSHQEGEELLNRIIAFIDEKQVFLNSELKISDLARMMNMSSHDISQVINQHLQQSFSDYINTCRIREFLKRIENPDYSKYTMVAVAHGCGFNSKTSFYRVFKKEKGQTPVEYLKNNNLTRPLK